MELINIMHKLELMDKKLDELLGNPAEGTIKKSPFGDSIYKDGKWQSVPYEKPDRIPVIHNNEDNPPVVADARVKILAWIEDETGFGEWYSIWESSNATSIARIEPWSDKDRENMARCNKAPQEGTFTYHSVKRLPAKWNVVSKARNPWLPIPPGCRLAADGCTLEDDI